MFLSVNITFQWFYKFFCEYRVIIHEKMIVCFIVQDQHPGLLKISKLYHYPYLL